MSSCGSETFGRDCFVSLVRLLGLWGGCGGESVGTAERERSGELNDAWQSQLSSVSDKNTAQNILPSLAIFTF